MADQKTFKAIFLAVDKASAPMRQIQKNIKKIGDTTGWMGSMGNAMGVAVASSVAAVGLSFIGLGKAFDAYSEQVRTSAEKTSLSTDTFQTLAFVAQRADVPVEALTGAFGRMNRTIGESFVGKGNEATAVLKKMGINAQNFKRIAPEEQFGIIVESLSKIKNPALQAVAANTILGKGYQSLMPLINKGADGIAKFTAEAKKRGLIIDKKDLDAIDDVGDSIGSIGSMLKAVSFKGIAAALPAIQKVIDGLDIWLTKNKEIMSAKIGAYLEKIGTSILSWVENGGIDKLFTTIEKITNAISDVLDAVGGLKGLAVISAVMIGLSVVLPILGSIVGIIGVIAANWTLLIGLIGLISAPVLAVVGAFALVGIAAYAFYENFDEIVGSAKALWDDFSNFISDSWADVSNSVGNVLKQIMSDFNAMFDAIKNNPIVNFFADKIAKLNLSMPDLMPEINNSSTTNLLTKQKVDAGLTVRFEGAPAGMRVDSDNQGFAKFKTNVGYLQGAM